MTTPIYAVGDIHGHIDELDRILDEIAADGGADAEIVFLGDYVDRGPDSRAVIERLGAGIAAGRNWHAILGNHDRMFLRFARSGVVHDDRVLSGKGWLHRIMGGVATLASYGVAASERDDPARIRDAAARAVPAEHLAFLESRPLHVRRGELLFVHAGIIPQVPLDRQTEDDLLWIRRPFLDYVEPHPWLVVHGHTALEAPFHFGNRVDLDGGAGYGRPLSAAVFEGTACWLLAGNDRLRLAP